MKVYGFKDNLKKKLKKSLGNSNKFILKLDSSINYDSRVFFSSFITQEKMTNFKKALR